MNDATNRFVNVETGKAMVQRMKKKTPRVSTPADKLTMSDLDAKRIQNNSMHKKKSVEASGTNLGQYLFGGSGSGDEMSLASSVNSTSSTSSSTCICPPRSAGRSTSCFYSNRRGIKI